MTSGRARACILALAALIWAFWNLRLHLLWRANQLPAYDFGVFTQIAWSLGHRSPLADQRMSLLNGVHWLGDHFQPIVAVDAPFVALIGPIGQILVETTAVVLGLVPLTRLALRHTSPLVAIGIAAIWLLNPGTWYAVLFPVHPSTLVAPLLVALVDAGERGRWRWMGGWAFLALCCKEDVGFYLAAIGLWLAFARGFRGPGLVLAAVGAVTAVVCVHWVVPGFRGAEWHIFELAPRLREGGWVNPVRDAAVALDSSDKRQLILTTVASAGFLPLADPLGLALVPFLAERLLGANPNHTLATFHYGGPAVAITSTAALFAAERIRARVAAKTSADGIMVGAMLLGCLCSHLAILGTGGRTDTPPTTLSLLTDPSGARTADEAAVDDAVALIPQNASVLAQDTLVARLADRVRVGILTHQPPGLYEYILVDPALPCATGKAPLVDMIRRYDASPDYGLIYARGSVALWRRGVADVVVLPLTTGAGP